MIRAGDLDRRITIQSVTNVPDTVGNPAPTPTTLVTDLPAKYMPVKGKEKFSEEQTGRELSFRTAKFLIRFRSDVNVKSRILYDGLTWDVIYVSEVGKREGLELIADVII